MRPFSIVILLALAIHTKWSWAHVIESASDSHAAYVPTPSYRRSLKSSSKPTKSPSWKSKSPSSSKNPTKYPTKSPSYAKKPTKSPSITKYPTKSPSSTRKPTKSPSYTHSPHHHHHPSKSPSYTHSPHHQSHSPSSTKSPSYTHSPHHHTKAPSVTKSPSHHHHKPTLSPSDPPSWSSPVQNVGDDYVDDGDDHGDDDDDDGDDYDDDDDDDDDDVDDDDDDSLDAESLDSLPTGQPTRQPTSQPSGQPSEQPTKQPSSQPSKQPTSQPSGQPSSQPTTHPTKGPTPVPQFIELTPAEEKDWALDDDTSKARDDDVFENGMAFDPEKEAPALKAPTEQPTWASLTGTVATPLDSFTDPGVATSTSTSSSQYIQPVDSQQAATYTDPNAATSASSSQYIQPVDSQQAATYTDPNAAVSATYTDPNAATSASSSQYIQPVDSQQAATYTDPNAATSASSSQYIQPVDSQQAPGLAPDAYDQQSTSSDSLAIPGTPAQYPTIAGQGIQDMSMPAAAATPTVAPTWESLGGMPVVPSPSNVSGVGVKVNTTSPQNITQATNATKAINATKVTNSTNSTMTGNATAIGSMQTNAGDAVSLVNGNKTGTNGNSTTPLVGTMNSTTQSMILSTPTAKPTDTSAMHESLSDLFGKNAKGSDEASEGAKEGDESVDDDWFQRAHPNMDHHDEDTDPSGVEGAGIDHHDQGIDHSAVEEAGPLTVETDMMSEEMFTFTINRVYVYSSGLLFFMFAIVAMCRRCGCTSKTICCCFGSDAATAAAVADLATHFDDISLEEGLGAGKAKDAQAYKDLIKDRLGDGGKGVWKGELRSNAGEKRDDDAAVVSGGVDKDRLDNASLLKRKGGGVRVDGDDDLATNGDGRL